MSLKVTLALILIALFAFRLWQTTGCKNFNSFRLNPLAIKINVESQRNIDQKSSNLISKIFHNKVSTGLFEETKNYLSLFNPNLIISLVGPIGLISLILAIIRGLNKRNRAIFASLAYVFLSAFLATKLDPKQGILNFAFSLYLFCFWAISAFSASFKMMAVFIFLAIFSFWYFSFDWQMPLICNEIFFN